MSSEKEESCQHIRGIVDRAEKDIALIHRHHDMCCEWTKLLRRNITTLLTAMQRVTPMLQEHLLQVMPLSLLILQLAAKASAAAHSNAKVPMPAKDSQQGSAGGEVPRIPSAAALSEQEANLLKARFAAIPQHAWGATITSSAFAAVLPVLTDWLSFTKQQPEQYEKTRLAMYHLQQGACAYPALLEERCHRARLRNVLVELESAADDESICQQLGASSDMLRVLASSIRAAAKI